jgi:hypothetical protein
MAELPNISALSYQEVEPMRVTTFEKGSANGRREAVRFQLEHRFGPLNAMVLQRLENWPAERLNELLLDLLDAPSLHSLGLEEGDGKS